MSVEQKSPEDLVISFYQTYYREEIGKLAQRYPNERKSLEVSWRDVYQWKREFAEDIIDHPDQIRQIFEEALRLFDLPADINLANANVRFSDLPDDSVMTIDQIRSDQIGNFVGIFGQIKQQTGACPMPKDAAFECQRCGTMTYIPQNGDEFQEPHECQGCERKGPFKLDHKQTEWIDVEWLRIQQPPEQVKGGSAREIDVMVDDDLVQHASPGDRVTISGRMDVESPSDNAKRPLFDANIKARSIKKDQSDYEEIEIDEQMLQNIKEFASGEHGDPYQLLIDSIEPEHYGDENIKLALAMQMFGAVRAKKSDGSEKRGDSHILLIGDPGAGKSSMLRAVEQIAPRSTYASGKGASAAGLTAAVSASDFAGHDKVLEAGALVLANKGVACIDEIDKINEEISSSMHDALENQTVEINKWGIDTSLPAKTSVLAAGNPKYGRFDRYEPIAEQIDMSPTLLSRFDLIFVVTDQADADKDGKIAETVLESWSEGTEISKNPHSSRSSDVEPAVDEDTLRAWIAYARQNVKPSIGTDVKQHIKEYYVSLRSTGEDDSAIPVTARKLEAIIRLAQASARIRLSETVSIEDAKRATDLIEDSMRDYGFDPEAGQFDADIVETGMSKSQRDRIQMLLKTIDELAREHEDGAPFDAVVSTMTEYGYPEDKIVDSIQSAKDKGSCYEMNGNLRTT